MARKSMIAALLLPLPFAALPVISVLLAHPGGSHANRIEVHSVPVIQPAEVTHLAYGVTESPQGGCGTGQVLAIEG